MKIADLNEVKKLDERLRRVRASYHNNFNNKNTTLRVTLSLDKGNNTDTTPIEVLDLDLTMEGPIAALVCQAYRKKIKELEKALRDLGVDLDSD